MGNPTASESALSASAEYTPAPRNGKTPSLSPAPMPCDTSTLTARSKPNPKQITVHSAMPPRPTPANDAGPRRPTNAVSTTVITVNDKVETVIGQANDTSSRNNEPLENGREACRTDTGNLEENGAKCKKAAGPCGAAALTEPGERGRSRFRSDAALPREAMPRPYAQNGGAVLASVDSGGSSSNGSSDG